MDFGRECTSLETISNFLLRNSNEYTKQKPSIEKVSSSLAARTAAFGPNSNIFHHAQVAAGRRFFLMYAGGEGLVRPWSRWKAKIKSGLTGHT